MTPYWVEQNDLLPEKGDETRLLSVWEHARYVEVYRAEDRLRWTKDAPTVPGFYWWRYDETAPRLSICELVLLHDGRLVEQFDHRHLLMQEDGEWAGPLEVPQ